MKSHEPHTVQSRDSSELGYPRRFATQQAHTPEVGSQGYRPVRQSVNITPPPITSRTPDIAKVNGILNNRRDNHMKIDENSTLGAEPSLPRVSTMMAKSLLKKELQNMSTALADLKRDRQDMQGAFNRY